MHIVNGLLISHMSGAGVEFCYILFGNEDYQQNKTRLTEDETVDVDGMISVMSTHEHTSTLVV